MECLRIVLEAVNSGKLAYAREVVDSKLQKDPEDGLLQSLKVHVASFQNDQESVLEAAPIAVSQCNKQTLRLFLIPALLACKASALLNAAFERVNRQDPQDREITEAWVECSLELGSLEHAQKALIAGMRTSTNQRNAAYSACFLMALNNQPGPLFPALAQRMLDKHLPVASAQECYVAAMVYRMKSVAEMTDFLAANAKLVDGSLDLELLLLDGLMNQNKFAEAWDCGAKVAKGMDSLEIWKKLNIVARRLNHEKSAVRTVTQCEPQSLNEMIAELDWENTPHMLLACWERLRSKPGAFPLLKEYVNTENIELLKGDDLARINVAKLRNHLGLKSDDLMDVYAKHLTERAPEKDYLFVTDALLMHVTALLRADGEFARERAVCLLENALVTDPYHFQVKLLLIALYKSLGLHAAAYKLFRALDIKHIQLEGLAYLLTTRIATLAPHAARPLVSLLSFHRKNMPKFGFYSSYALSSNSFTQFVGLFELGRKLHQSLATTLFEVEKFQLARFAATQTDLNELYGGELIDSRDFKTAFDDGFGPLFGADVPAISLGPKVGQEYAALLQRRELFIAKRRENKPAEFKFVTNASLTSIEAWNLQVIEAISKGASSTPPLPEAPQTLDWQFYHWAYTIIDTLRTAQLLRHALDSTALKKTLRGEIAKHQQSLTSYEQRAVKQMHGLPGTPQKQVRLMKQQQVEALKQLADELK